MPQAEHQHTIYAPLQFVDERQSARPRGYYTQRYFLAHIV